MRTKPSQELKDHFARRLTFGHVKRQIRTQLSRLDITAPRVKESEIPGSELEFDIGPMGEQEFERELAIPWKR
jgi:hypothetical protein